LHRLPTLQPQLLIGTESSFKVRELQRKNLAKREEKQTGILKYLPLHADAPAIPRMTRQMGFIRETAIFRFVVDSPNFDIRQ
jgi:hypothetical protein